MSEKTLKQVKIHSSIIKKNHKVELSVLMDIEDPVNFSGQTTWLNDNVLK